MYERANDENNTLTHKCEDYKTNIHTLETTIEELQLQLNRANYIIGKANDGEVSVGIADEDEPHDEIDQLGTSSQNQTQLAISSQRGLNKSRVLKLDKSDEEIKAYLKTIQAPAQKVRFSKSTQTAFDPLRMLIEAKDKLVEMSYGQDLVKTGIDVLLRLLGFSSLEDMLKNPRKNAGLNASPQPSGKPGAPGNRGGLQVPHQRDDKKKSSVEPIWYGPGTSDEDDLSPEPIDHHQINNYPVMKLGRKKPVVGPSGLGMGAGNNGYPTPKKPIIGNTRSNVKKQNVSPPPDRFMVDNDDDHFRHQNVVKINPSPVNPNRYTEKQMQADYDDFRSSLGRGGDENNQDEYEVYLSKIRIEKELTLFRMYLNIKRR